jgi:hypothetical protein
MAGDHDALMRRNRLRPVSTGKRVRPQDRDLLWFAKLHEHGPLPSSFLLQYSQDMRRSDKRARERLTDLFNEENTPDGGPYLARPPQQFRTIDSRYNQLVYGLTPASEQALKQANLWNPRSSARSGPWLHGFMVSCITASIELATLERPDLAYIPQSRILERADTELRWPTTIADPSTGRPCSKDLLPDALFGLEYQTDQGGRFRFFVVEADRATEPATSTNFNRKSFLRNLLQYERYIGQGEYREHLKLTAPLMVLNVSTDMGRMQRMIELSVQRYAKGNAFLLFQTWPDFGSIFRPPPPRCDLLTSNWARGGLGAFCVDRL